MARFMGVALAAVFFAATTTTLVGQSSQAGAKGIPEGKIAVVNADAFPEKILELKAKYDQIEAQYKPRFEKLRQMSEDLKKLEDDLRTDSKGLLSADKKRQLEADYENLKRRGTREEADLHDEVGRVLDTAIRPIQEKMSRFIAAYATQRNIVAVFNLKAGDSDGVADTGMFAFWNPGTDITDDFVAEYNKANPVAGAAAPAKP